MNGSEEASAAPVPAAPTAAEIRKMAIAAYYDAATKEAKAAAVEKYPVLKEIFSEVNHS